MVSDLLSTAIQLPNYLYSQSFSVARATGNIRDKKIQSKFYLQPSESL